MSTLLAQHAGNKAEGSRLDCYTRAMASSLDAQRTVAVFLCTQQTHRCSTGRDSHGPRCKRSSCHVEQEPRAPGRVPSKSFHRSISQRKQKTKMTGAAYLSSATLLAPPAQALNKFLYFPPHALLRNGMYILPFRPACAWLDRGAGSTNGCIFWFENEKYPKNVFAPRKAPKPWLNKREGR